MHFHHAPSRRKQNSRKYLHLSPTSFLFPQFLWMRFPLSLWYLFPGSNVELTTIHQSNPLTLTVG